MSRWFARASVVALAVVAASTFGARGGYAQLVNEEAVGRLTIGGSIGILLPAMSDVNGNIDVVNPFLTREEIRELDPINRALLTGLDIRWRLGNSPKEDPEEAVRFLDRLSVGFTWGGVNARTDFEVSRANVRLYSRATTYSPYVLYHLPFLDSTAPRIQLVVGGGPLLLRSGVVQWSLVDLTHNDFFTTIEHNVGDLFELSGQGEAKGSALGFALQTGGTFMLNRRFSLGLDLGYRMAKISNLEISQAIGQARFLGQTQDKVRRPGDWAMIDFFMRDPNTVFEGRARTDLQDPQDPEAGGCGDNPETPEYDPCPQYYRGGPLEVDYSGPFANVTFGVHF